MIKKIKTYGNAIWFVVFVGVVCVAGVFLLNWSKGRLAAEGANQMAEYRQITQKEAKEIMDSEAATAASRRQKSLLQWAIPISWNSAESLTGRMLRSSKIPRIYRNCVCITKKIKKFEKSTCQLGIYII